MKFNETGAFILSETKNGERIVSCGGRISTKPGTAVELYKKAIEINPKEANAYILAGNMYSNLKKFKEAPSCNGCSLYGYGRYKRKGLFLCRIGNKVKGNKAEYRQKACNNNCCPSCSP